MFTNRSVRLFLLATAMIPATATFGVLKMQAQVTPDAPVLLAAPAKAVPAAGNCASFRYLGDGMSSKSFAIERLKEQLASYCIGLGCLPNEQSIETQYYPGQTGSWVARGQCMNIPLIPF